MGDDYLARAANPIDGLGSQFGSMMTRVGHGIQHTVDRINNTFWPHHSSNARYPQAPVSFINYLSMINVSF